MVAVMIGCSLGCLILLFLPEGYPNSVGAYLCAFYTEKYVHHNFTCGVRSKINKRYPLGNTIYGFNRDVGLPGSERSRYIVVTAHTRKSFQDTDVMHRVLKVSGQI